MANTPDDFPIFGLRPDEGADKKKGDRAEAGRPRGEDMNAVTTLTNIPQSIATTVSMFDAQEREHRDREVAAATKWLDEMMRRSIRGVFSETVTITPVMAALILDRNPGNRKISRKLVAEIRADLENGNWVFNGESVIIADNGELNDGQHRLLACRQSGVPIRTVVVFGVPRAARMTTDQGKARTVGDYLGMDGVVDDPIVVAAVARLLWQYDTYGTVLHRQLGYGEKERARQPTKSEIRSVAIEHGAEIARSITFVRRGYKMLGGQSLLAFCHIIFARTAGIEAADFFIQRLLDGAGLEHRHPVHTLRERLTHDKKMITPQRFEAIVRAWNAYRQQRPLEKIQLMGRTPKIES